VDVQLRLPRPAAWLRQTLLEKYKLQTGKRPLQGALYTALNGCNSSRRLVAHQSFVLELQLLPAFLVTGVQRNAFHRADFHTLGDFKMPDTFCTQIRVDFVDFLTLVDCIVRALRLTDITIDAFICNH
jgi:hypothetical protein